ncbi:MAG: hypothetical protein ABJC61_11005 [Acidobacteriota bacterium]
MICQPPRPPRRGGTSAGLRLSFLLAALLASPPDSRAATIGGPVPPPLPLFPRSNWWNLDVSNAPPDPGSAAYIAWIAAGGVTGMHPDFGGNAGPVGIYGFPYVVVPGFQAKKAFTFQYWDESDGVNYATHQGTAFYPLPDEAITQIHWIEGGQAGNAAVGGDRHVLILDPDHRALYELYHVKYDTTAGKWIGGSGAFFDLTKNDRRPDTWTSADAAGLAIFPGLVRYDEFSGPGEIEHAFRVTLRDSNGYVYPASHDAGSLAGALPMGARLRLKAATSISGFSAPIQKIFRAMKKYGLILADNGTDLFVSGTYDTRWDNGVLNPAFSALGPDDFEVVKLGYMPQVPAALSVDAHPGTGTSSDANGVLEPGESVLVEPTWTYQGTSAATLTGVASGLWGPAGAAYGLGDASASYGAVPAVVTGNGDTVGCRSTTGNCYRVSVSSPPNRPATHWDASFDETLSTSGIRKWMLHVGDSFDDVPRSNLYYPKIEALLHAGVTSGCAPAGYCPGDTVPRSQMAIFIANALARGGGNVPVSGVVGTAPYTCAPGGTSVYADVLATDSFCRHVHYLAAQNVTLGCSTGLYCPSTAVSRIEMAGFVAKATLAPGGGAAVPLAYGPDAETGRSYSCAPAAPSLHFTDVPASDPFCKHAHYLWARGAIAGCSPSEYCPVPAVTRAEMAKFLSKAFGLALYGP